MTTVYQCPLCKSGTEHHHYFDRIIDKLWIFDHYEPRHIIYAICAKCGLVFHWERMSDKDIDHYYNAQYRQTIQGGTDAITDRVIAEQKKRAEALLPEIGLETVKNALDIGSSTGVLLTAIKNKYGCEAIGVEPGERFRHGSEVYSVSELEILGPQRMNMFDLVTIIHTLEHIPNPVEYLLQIHDWITDDGHLLIEVPDLFGDNTLRISHPISFTPKTLTETVQHAGFEVEWIKGFESFKTGYPAPPNILAMCKPGRMNERVAFVDIEQVKSEYQKGQEALHEYMARTTVAQTDKTTTDGVVQPVSG